MTRAIGRSLLVGACAALLIALAGAYYLNAARYVLDDAEHVAVAIAACVVAVPWLMVAIAITRRHMAVAMLMAMSSAIAFLSYATWWGIDLSMLPRESRRWDAIDSVLLAMSLVHVTALLAAISGWRNLSPGDRSFDGKAGVALLPIVTACALALLARKWGHS